MGGESGGGVRAPNAGRWGKGRNDVVVQKCFPRKEVSPAGAVDAIVPMRQSPLLGAHARRGPGRESADAFGRCGRLVPLARSGGIAPAILPAVKPPSPRPTARGRGLRELALLTNGLLLVAGLYFEVRPQDRGDVWSAGGIVAIAVLNVAALTIPRGRRQATRVGARLRRIALIANTLLLASGLLLAGAESLREWSRAGLHGLALVVPPLVTILALRGEESRSGGPGAGSL